MRSRRTWTWPTNRVRSCGSVIGMIGNWRKADGRSEPCGWVVARLLVFALVSTITTTGCSFVGVRRPAAPGPGGSSETQVCTSTYWLPALDAAGTALLSIAAVSFAAMSKSDFANFMASQSSSTSSSGTTVPSTTSANEQYWFAAASGIGALGTLAGAVYGFRSVAKCRQLKEEALAAEASRPAPVPSVSSSTPAAQPPLPPPPGFRGKRMAVLEFQGKNMDQDILMTFSDTVRGGALQGIAGRGIVVMTRENMLVLLRDMGKQDCGEGDCEVETARSIGADYVITGKVVRIEQLYVVTLKMHETRGGSLISTDTVEGASQLDILRSLREHARQLMTSAFGTRPDAAPAR